MKAGWEAVALGEVCEKIQDGAHHSPKHTISVREPGTFPYVTSKNIRNWYLDENNVTYVGPEFHDTIYPRCNAEFGDVLLTKDGANTGQVTVNTFREPISLLSSVCLIKPNRSKLDPRFLVYYIQSDAGFENITGQMTGAAIKRIILKKIKLSGIPLPPLEEQQRIVAVLDQAFAGLARARAHAEANLQNARELFESVLNDAFSNLTGNSAKAKLSDLVEISHGFAFKSADFETSTNRKLPIVLTPGNYTEDASLNFNEKNTKRFFGSIPDEYLFAVGDLTVVMTDLSSKMKILGKPAFIEDKNILHNQRIGRVIFRSDTVEPRLIFHFLRTKMAQKSIKDSSTGTMVRHTAPKRILRAFSDQSASYPLAAK